MAKRPQQNADRGSARARQAGSTRAPGRDKSPDAAPRDDESPRSRGTRAEGARSSSQATSERGGRRWRAESEHRAGHGRHERHNDEPGGFASWAAGFIVIAGAGAAMFG